jgi:hypothetical protein
MLGMEPEELSMQRWKSFVHHWQSYNESNASTETHCFHMNEVFANCSKENKIYPPTTAEIAETQQADATLKHLFKRNAVIDQGLEIKLIENTICVCKDGWLFIPKSQATPCACSQMVSPLPTAPWTHMSQRDNQCSSVLERYVCHHLVDNKVLQILPNK